MNDCARSKKTDSADHLSRKSSIICSKDVLKPAVIKNPLNDLLIHGCLNQRNDTCTDTHQYMSPEARWTVFILSLISNEPSCENCDAKPEKHFSIIYLNHLLFVLYLRFNASKPLHSCLYRRSPYLHKETSSVY